MDFLTPTVQKAMLTATWETIEMVLISGVVTVVIGLLLGILLHVTGKGGLMPVRWLNVVLSGIIVNITRSIPFAILMVALIPFAVIVVGTSLGPIAASVSLTIGTIPFFARLVETALRDVSSGKVDAALVMGSTKMQVIRKVMVPEAMPGIVAAVTTTVVTLIGYSAMAGLVGGGGLGRMAYTYGYTRYNPEIMLMTIIIIVVMVQVVQIIGDVIARKVDHR
ncbi:MULTISPECIES: methionine ABC transporter permease [Micrococcaceae]|uniref:ABC transporter permease n=1 Tax=Glutamicibacter soli TaxID=453836 RepID=A0A365YP12_9MICC|nr:MULTISPECIES: methionine ABC transporter permease [Micrococcaceae]ALD64397.1 metal ABC transporter permease [Arthrobacter sp. LS16]ALQ30328.1 metal ABC transporter permease [Arthrobacter sp. YC-RL1]KLI88362.1 metal ABC transporter permease [Arthrobacter sp. YC-RL1]NAZ14511.1 methionine ABC transporter permease MetI [Glutamicibacter soli]RBM04269.1 ABC transporter permease [Glutamicibacter soli]